MKLPSFAAPSSQNISAYGPKPKMATTSRSAAVEARPDLTETPPTGAFDPEPASRFAAVIRSATIPRGVDRVEVKVSLYRLTGAALIAEQLGSKRQELLGK